MTYYQSNTSVQNGDTANAQNSILVANPDLNPALTQGRTPIGDSLPSTTINASDIQNYNANSTGSVQFPPNPTQTNAQSTNASVPSPAPSLTDIAKQAAAPNQADTNQQTILNRIAQLTKGDQSLATLQTQQENQAGVPKLTGTVNTLNAQLQGLNDQATLLQNQYNYDIPNQEQLDATGRGVTSGGLAPVEASDLRVNQIKQGQIATQSLTVKSALYAANNQLSLAKDAADKAAQVAFDAQTQEINYQQALLNANKPLMDKQDAAQAQMVQAQLDQRKTQLQYQREDYTSGLGLIAGAMKNFTNNPAVTSQQEGQFQLDLQAAQKLDPNDPQYLQKVTALMAKYQQDPLATQKAVQDMSAQRVQTQLAQANINKINNEIKNSQPLTVTPENAPLINAFNFAVTGLTSAQQAQSKQTFVNLLNQGDTQASKDYVVRTAISNLPTSEQTLVLGRYQAINALSDVQDLLQQAKSQGADTNILTGNITNIAQKLGTTNDPNLTYISSRIQQELQVYRRAMTGVAFSPQESAQYAKIFPDITNTDALNTTKIQALVDGLNSNNRTELSTYIGDQNYNALFGQSTTNQLPGGSSNQPTTVVYKGGIYTVDAQGNMTQVGNAPQ